MGSAKGRNEDAHRLKHSNLIDSSHGLQSERIFRLLAENLTDYALFLLTPKALSPHGIPARSE